MNNTAGVLASLGLRLFAVTVFLAPEAAFPLAELQVLGHSKDRREGDARRWPLLATAHLEANADYDNGIRNFQR